MNVNTAGTSTPDLVGEDCYRLLFEASPDWLEWRGTDQRCQLISPACEIITGYPPEAFIADPELLFELIHPDDRQPFSEHQNRALGPDSPASEWEFRIHHRNGELRWVSQRYQPLFRGGERIGQLIVRRDITGQKTTIEELRQRNRALQAIINAPRDVIILINQDLTIEFGNQTLADHIGKPMTDLIGKSILEALPLKPELARERAANMRQVFETGQPVRAEDMGASGGIFDNFYFPDFDEQGTVRLVAVIARDVTQRKLIEDKLRQSNKIIQALFNAPTDIATVFNLDGIIELANDTLARALRRSPGELIGTSIWDYFPPEMTRYRKVVVEKAIQTGKPQRLIDPGISGHYDSNVVPILDEAGRVTLIAILARDISEQINAQEALSQREAMLSSILNDAPIVLVVLDRQGVITYTDGRALTTAINMDEKLIGKNIRDFSETAPIFDAGIHTALQGQDYAFQITTVNQHTFEARLTPLSNQAGEITGVIGVGIDVTENQKIQAELRRSKEELQTILESIADAVFVNDAQGRIIYANLGALKMGQFASLQDLIKYNGTPSGFVFFDESGKQLSQSDLLAARATAIGKAEPTVLCYLSPDSSDKHWLRIKVTPLFGENHELRLTVSVFHDITELKLAQAALEASHLELEKKIVERTAQLNQANQELVQRVAERRRAAMHAEALANVAARVNLQTDLPSTLQTVCEEVLKAVNYPYCSIFLYDEQKDELRLAAPPAPPDGYPLLEATPRELYEFYLRIYGPVIVIPDRQALPEKLS